MEGFRRVKGIFIDWRRVRWGGRGRIGIKGYMMNISDIFGKGIVTFQSMTNQHRNKII